MDDHLATEAARIGVPDEDALTSYEQGRRNAPDRSASKGHRGATPRLARAAVGPTNPVTGSQLSPPDPTTPTAATNSSTTTGTSAPPATVVAGTGYHPGSGRLEVDHPGRRGHGLPATSRRRWPNNSAPAPTRTRCTGTACRATPRSSTGTPSRPPPPGYAGGAATAASSPGPPTTASAAAAASGPAHSAPSPRCSQHLSPTWSCPASVTAAYDLPVRIAPLGQIIGGLERVRGEGVEFPFQATYPGGEQLTGSLSGALDTDDHVSINSAHLTCTCDGYAPGQGCPHIQAAATGVRDALAQQLIDSRTATAQATAAAIAGRSATTRPAAEAALPDAPDLSTFSYTQDPARFTDDVRAALARPTDEQVPWIDATDTEPGLYGYGAARDFGVELEFDIDRNTPAYGDLDLDQRLNGRYRYAGQLAIGRVARALYENNFTTHDRQSGYHSAVRQGYQRNLLGGWMYESDGSVQGGEVVSPILSDTPETWQRLHQVCGIITGHGGTASAEHRVPHHRQRTRTSRSGRAAHPVPAADAPPPTGPAHHGRRRPAPRPGLLHGHARTARPGIHQHHHSTANARPVQLHQHRAHRHQSQRTRGEQQPRRVPALGRIPRARPHPGADQNVHRDPGLHRPQPGPQFPVDERTPAGTLNPDHPEFADDTRQIRGLIDQLFRRDTDKQQATALWAAGLGARNFTREYLP